MRGLERAGLITRGKDAPRRPCSLRGESLCAVVESAEREHIGQWFGLQGFTIGTREIDIRVGGRWRIDMIAPDGACRDHRLPRLR